MRISIPEGKIQFRLDQSLMNRVADQIVFYLLLLSTLGILLPFSLNSTVSLLAYPATFLLLIHRWKQVLYVLTRDLSYLFLILLAIASITWSAAPSGTIAIVRALVNTTILVAYIAASYSPKRQMQLWAKIFFIWGFASLLVEVIFPDYTKFALGRGGQEFWQGIFTFKLGLGVAMSLGIILAIYSLINTPKKKWGIVGCIGIAFLLIIFSESKTSLLACLAVLAVFPIYFIGQLRNYRLRTTIYLLIFLLGLAVAGFVTLNFETILVDWLGKDLTMTGRASLWEAIIHQGLQRPWFGYGHGAFWLTENSLNAIFANDWPSLPRSGEYLESFHSHSGYIELFLNLGAVGVLLFALNYILTCRRIIFLFMALKGHEFLWMIQIIVFTTIINYSEVGSFLIGRNLLWILYSTTVLSSALEKEKYQFRFASD